MKRCNHSKVVKGKMIAKISWCKVCGKIIIKGKKTPNGAFGRPND